MMKMKAYAILFLSAGILIAQTGLMPIAMDTAVSEYPSDNMNRSSRTLKILQPETVFSPLDEITVFSAADGIIEAADGKGAVYASGRAGGLFTFIAAGALGRHTVSLKDSRGRVLQSAYFTLDAQTKVDDGGEMAELFAILKNGLFNTGGGKGYGQAVWNGQAYRYYVPWDLDHNSVLNGMQYFLPYGGEFTDLLRETQRDDGMIWSFVRSDSPNGSESAYYKTAYEPLGFFRKDGETFFARQPVDNHSDYNYVNQFYKHWKAGGDDAWMEKTLESAVRALDYCYMDSLRWSERFQLLKRPYCIDSWDFQVMDEYTPDAPISPSMVIVPGKTKFGIFFGDNTGYYEACSQVAEMLEYSGQNKRAEAFRERGRNLLENLMKVSWNGRFFTHFVDEDPAVVRDLGVDEKSRIAQGNMYSLNRGLPIEVNRAIIKTYLDLRNNLPQGSPGEWYSIYPPFGRGFEEHGSQWQYMNGGVAGHAIGEMARGAYESGYEDYASDVMKRMLALARKYGSRLYFSYTGKIPDPPGQYVFSWIDLSSSANMDLWSESSPGVSGWMNETRQGNDLRGIPAGLQRFDGIPFMVIDPDQNFRKAAAAVSHQQGFPEQCEIHIDRKAGAVYLLHTVSGMGENQVAGAVSFIFEDGTCRTQHIMGGRDITGWWFPSLNTERSGVAWYGPNPVSAMVGVCWAAIDNPMPDKIIKSIKLHAPQESGIYAVLGVTLSDKPHYVPPSPISFGGPDNWTSGNGMGALVEGLAGVQNTGTAFSRFRLVPRWLTADIDSADVIIRFAASDGYAAYRYLNRPEKKRTEILAASSGEKMRFDFIVPENKKIRSITINGHPVKSSTIKSGKYRYESAELNISGLNRIIVQYE